MDTKITKTYLGSTGTNYKTETNEDDGTVTITTTPTATFHVDFPMDFVNSTNRRFITVMPPTLVWGASTVGDVYIAPSLPMSQTKNSKIADNYYIMHCSFIHRDPYHDRAVINVNTPKRKYKKYEYKGCDDGFDITFTDYFPAFDNSGWHIGARYDTTQTNINSFHYEDLVKYFQTNFPDADADSLANQVLDLYTTDEDISTIIQYYRDNLRFESDNQANYVTTYDWFDYVFYVIQKNGIELPLEFRHETSKVGLVGDYYTYETKKHYIDKNINRYVSYSRYIKYKILKDTQPWYYYAEFMVEY